MEAGPVIFSKDRRYRYRLTRTWDDSLPAVAWIGLNPSTADESALDPTLRRILGFSREWGFGTFHMLNLFAFRATDPDAMKASSRPVGLSNDIIILQTVRDLAEQTIACWGVHGVHRGRGPSFRSWLRHEGIDLYHLGLTKDGQPKHPLYLPKTAEIRLWSN